MRRFTTGQISEYLGVTKTTVLKWIADKKIAAVRETSFTTSMHGKTSYVVSEKELRRFISEHPKYNFAEELIWPKDQKVEERRIEINACFDKLKYMKADVNRLVTDMNSLIEHLNTLLNLEKQGNE